MGSSLEVKEGGLHKQGTGEKVPYSVTATRWGSSPGSSAVVAYDLADWADVTTTLFPTNTPTESGDKISLSLCQAVTKGHTYRIEVYFKIGTAEYETHFFVEAVR